MQITLAASLPADAPALEELLQSFLEEVGYPLGAKLADDGRLVLQDLEPPPGGHFSIWVDGKLAGFAIAANLESDVQAAKLVALYVAREFRRKHVGQRVLAALFEKRGGTWAIEVPIAIQTAVQFINATLHLFSKQGVQTEHTTDTERGRIAHLRFDVALPSKRSRSNWISGGGRNPGFPFDRSHHAKRRWILVGAALLGPAIAWLGASMASGSASVFFVFVGSITSTVLGAVYLEMVVTGILDRQDRGPILPPIWEDRE